MQITEPTALAKAGPTGIRYAVLGLLCMLAMITYIDRAVIGNAKADVMASVGRGPDDFFWLLVAFQFAYAVFEVPAGWMGDRFGPRGTLIRIVLWWSAFVALTGAAGLAFPGTSWVPIGFVVLVGVQFLFGMGEAGAFPNITRSLYNWFPSTSRGAAQGFVWMSARLMGGLTPLIWLLLTHKTYFAGLDWRTVFWMFAVIAVVWCAVFAWFFRDRPDQHSMTNQAERDLAQVGKMAGEDSHSGVPWGRLVSSPNLWAICGMYFCMNFGWYFFMYFLPGFMKDQFGKGMSGPGGQVMLALLAGGPLLLGIPGCLLGGYLTDLYVRRTGDKKWGRRIYGMIGFGMASVCYAGAVMGAGDVYVFAACIGLAGFFNDLTMGSCWATCQDVGRRYAAIVSGFMNMIGNLGAVLTNLVTGLIITNWTRPQIDALSATSAGLVGVAGDPLTGTTALGTLTGPLAAFNDAKFGAYPVCLTLYAIAYAIGVFFWLRIDASKPLVVDEPAAH